MASLTNQRRMTALLMLVATGVEGVREEIPFDFGWRFALGAVGAECTVDEFPFNTSNIDCSGLTEISWAETPQQCEAAACANGAQIWQFCKGARGSCGRADCWVGLQTECRESTEWISFARNGTSFDPAPANTTFDDSAWEVLDAPHDALITQHYDNNTNNGQASIPKNVTWYRKHFVLPSDWEGSHVEVYLEGAFSVTTAWLNGVQLGNHSCGYTSFALRLDNVSGIVWGGPNVLALYIDATITTGWWYEGGGLFRPTKIVRSSLLRVQDDGVSAPAFVEGTFHTRATPGQGMTVDTATIVPTVTVENANRVSSGVAIFSAQFTLFASDGVTMVGQSRRVTANASGGESIDLRPPVFTVTNAELWSIPRPYLHTLVVTLYGRGEVLSDAVNVSIGIRVIRWDAQNGMFLNEQAVKLRGFCNHNNFAAVGMAVPQRINLFRMQQMRGIGGNAWRMSHNPGSPGTFALGDRLGIAFLDENRVFTDENQYVMDMRDMVRRDRNHASILFWSFCNEVGCSSATEPALDFKYITELTDGSRAVTGNMFWAQVQESGNATFLLDVQGFSHQHPADFAAFHARYPEKPVLATECCSCESQRLEDSDLDHSGTNVTFTSWTQACTATESEFSNGVSWNAGTFVWTLHDYYGEPRGWPKISSAFGQIDLAGFPKAPAYWYRSWWLANVSSSDAGRPPVYGAGADVVVHIVETWTHPSKAGSNRTVHVYSSAPAVKLQLNGVAIGGVPQNIPVKGWAQFSVPYSAGTLTALAMSSSSGTGPVLASHSRSAWGVPTAIVLTLDAPTLATGTGSALYQDGGDVALVRATIVDAAGNPVLNATTVNVTFAVTSGPGLIWGCGNGDPANQEPNHAPWKTVYNGMARAVIRSTLDAATPDAVRARRLAIDIDAGKGPRSSNIMPVGGTPPSILMVSASAVGLTGGILSIPLSVDAAQAPLAVAAASVSSAYVGD